MVIPIPSTVVLPHPVFVETPKDIVKDVFWFRLVLMFLIICHLFLGVSLLVTPCPSLAFIQIFASFTGILAGRGTMPIRYYFYAALSGFACMATSIRVAERFPLPQFGYSKSYRLMQIAEEINGMLGKIPHGANISSYLLLSYRNAESSKSQKTIMLPAPASGIVTVVDVSDYLEYLSGSPRRDSQTRNPEELSSVSLTQQNSNVKARALLDLSHSTRNDGILNSMVEAPANPNNSMAQALPAIDNSIMEAQQTLEIPQSSSQKTMNGERSAFSQFADPKDKSTFLHVTKTPQKEPIIINLDLIDEYVNLLPSEWRWRLELWVLFCLSCLTAISVPLAVFCGKKIESLVSSSIAASLGMAVDETTDRLLPSNQSNSNIPLPYLREAPVNAFQPFSGQGVTLAQYSSAPENSAISNREERAGA